MANKHSLSATNVLEKSGDSISSLSNLQEDGMCEKVQSLADSVYKEFEQLIGVYGEQVLKELMPLVVAMLENLEQAMRDRQRLEVDAEMLRVDNEQLIGQYEKERGMRRNAEQRYLALEDQMDDERKQLQGRLEKMSSVVRMFEIKLKNSQDQVKRMEEKEEEGKKEYTKLHDRFNNLFKMHVDLKNKTKKGHSEVFEEEKDTLWEATLPRNFKFKRGSKDLKDEPSIAKGETNKEEVSDEESGQKRLIRIDGSLRRSLIGEIDEANKNFDEEASFEAEIKPFDSLSEHGSSHADDNAFQDHQEDEEAEANDGGDDDDFVSGVGKEIEGLIHENQELLQTKHALNIVKDDLIARVDELTGEKEILKDELDLMNESRERLRTRLNQCEENVRSLKEQLNATKDQSVVEVDDSGSSGQRKRFTRVEMARVLMERNLYKEKLMELQEAVRWAEMLRTTKNQVENKTSKSSVWNFFSNLFSNTSSNHSREQYRGDHSAVSYHRSDNDAKRNKLESDPPVIIREKSLAVLFQDENRVQAYGWSLPPRYHNITSSQPPSSSQPSSSSLQPSSSSSSSQPPPSSSSSSSSARDMMVAVPVMCKPLMDDVMASKIQCAVSVVWRGAKHYQRKTSDRLSLSKTISLEAEIGSFMDDEESSSSRRKASSSSQTPANNITDVNVWICVIDQTGSHVAVMDTAGGGDVIEKFNVCTANVMCMTFVPGYQEFNEEDEEEDELDECDDDDKAFKKRKESFDVKEEIPLGDIDEESVSIKNRTDNIESKEERREDGYDKEGSEKVKDGKKVGEEKKESSDGLLVHSSTDVPTFDPIQVSMVHVDDPNDLKHTNLFGKLHRKLSRSNSKTPPRDVDLDNFLNSNATVWVGSIAGNLYVFSAAPYSRNRLHLLKLPDSILSISHCNKQVFVAMANGSVACFSRLLTGAWNMKKYVLVQLSAAIKGPIRSTLVVDNTHLWLSVGNLIHAINIRNLSLLKSFSAHPRRESHVREMVLVGEGVWVVLRNESTLHLFHSTSFQHLQDVDIEPCVSQLLGSSYMGFSLVQISCLMAMEDNLWIGTGNGVVLRVPLSDTFDTMQTALNTSTCGGGKTPGSLVRVASNPSQEIKGRFMPYCSLTNSHVSLHGCREAIKFLVKAPTFKASKYSARQLFRKFSNPLPTSKSLSLPSVAAASSTTSDASWYIVCGGEGYVALKKEDNNSTVVSGKEDGSHVIMWQANVPSTQH